MFPQSSTETTVKSGQLTAILSPTSRLDHSELNWSRCSHISLIFLSSSNSLEVAREIRSLDLDLAIHSFQQMNAARSDCTDSSRPSLKSFLPRAFTCLLILVNSRVPFFVVKGGRKVPASPPAASCPKIPRLSPSWDSTTRCIRSCGINGS